MEFCLGVEISNVVRPVVADCWWCDVEELLKLQAVLFLVAADGDCWDGVGVVVDM